jgi:hypothetical protein
MLIIFQTFHILSSYALRVLECHITKRNILRLQDPIAGNFISTSSRNTTKDIID